MLLGRTLDKYSSHDLFRLLSINHSGLSLKYWTAAFIVQKGVLRVECGFEDVLFNEEMIKYAEQ